MKRFLRNRRISIPVGIGVLAFVAWLVFGFFGAHLLFVDEEVSEAAPTFGATAEAAAPTTTPGITPATDASQAAPAPTSPTAEAAAPTTVPDTTTATEPLASSARPSTPVTTPARPATATPPAAPVIVTEAVGAFVSRDHQTSGQVSVLGDGSGQRFLRFDDLATDNGPDLNVYLVNTRTGDVSDFVDLGNLKGNIGDQNYEIPVGTDLSMYDTVVIWCVRFSSNFGDAALTLN